jgi:hypothetical protein
LIIYGFTSHSRMSRWRIFHLYGDVTIAGEGLQNLGLYSGLWAGRDLYRATPAVTRDLGFSSLIRRTAPFSRLLRHTRGCGGSILTWKFGFKYYRGETKQIFLATQPFPQWKLWLSTVSKLKPLTKSATMYWLYHLQRHLPIQNS